MSKIITILKNLHYVPDILRHQKQANTENDRKLPMNAYPPVYEADELLRLTIAVTIVVSGAGLIAFGLSGLQKLEVLNVYALIYGGSIILFAFLYLASTATRLRYQNPGEAQSWYMSESGRRQSYDNMVEMFWTGLWVGVEFSIPFYLYASIHYHWLGALAALGWLTPLPMIGTDSRNRKQDSWSGSNVESTSRHHPHHLWRNHLSPSSKHIAHSMLFTSPFLTTIAVLYLI